MGSQNYILWHATCATKPRPLLLHHQIQIMKHLVLLLRPTAKISDDRFAVLTGPLLTIQVFWDDDDA
jgi:hypothetical protein